VQFKLTSIVFLMGLCVTPIAMFAQGKGIQSKSIPHFPEGKDRVVIRWEWGSEMLYTKSMSLDGHDVGWCAIATGSDTIVDLQRASTLGLRIIGRSRTGLEVTPLYAVNKLNVGGFQISEHFITSTLIDPTGRQVKVDGIVGSDVWSKTPFAIDYQKQTVTFYKREAFRPPAMSRQFDFEEFIPSKSDPAILAANPNMGQFLVRGKIDEIPALFELNTGASNTMLESRFTIRHKQFVSEKRKNLTAFAIGSPIIGKLQKARFRQLTLMGKEVARPRGVVAVVGPLSKKSKAADVTIGSDVMRHFQWWFDYEKRKVWAVWKPYPTVQQRVAGGLDPNTKDLAGESRLGLAAQKGDL
jgi:hypothetical protein